MIREYDVINKEYSWKANVKSIKNRGDCYEIRIESRGSGLTVIIGKYSGGWFACIPDWQAGTGLSDYLADTYYNAEALTKVIGNVDGLTVAQVLAKLYKEGLIG